MKRILLALLSIFTAFAAYAQPTGISVDIHAVHYGDVGSADLDGYVTYQVYVDMQNQDDFLSAIYGLVLDDENPDEQDLKIISDCDCWNDELFGGFIANTPEAIIPAFPEADFDTFWTIGKRYDGDEGIVYVNVANPVDFQGNDPCSDWIDDGVVYTLNGEPNGIAGEDQRVLILQITTCSDEFQVDFCSQTFIEGNPDNEFFSCPEPYTIQNPCISNALPQNTTTVNPILCDGDLATIEVGAGGNGDVAYDLFNANDNALLASQSGDPLFSGLSAGDYYIAMTDEVGCRDTIQTVQVTAPEPLSLTSEITYDANGDATICADISGGTSPFSLSLEDPEGGVSSVAEGECFTGVQGFNGGLFTLTVEDAVGCTVTESFTVDVFGCTDETACNYLETATVDDGSCLELDECGNCGGTATAGCTDSGACNFDPSASCDDDSCEYLSCAGCTDVDACNYDPEATIEDGSCLALDECGNCGGNATSGCIDNNACNFDPNASCDDGSCEYVSCAGCTDPEACNYDPEATIDDNSCFFANVIFDCQGNCLEDTDQDGICDQLEDPDGSVFCGENTVWDPVLEQCVSIADCGPEACGPGTTWDEALEACVTLDTCPQDLDNNQAVDTNDLLLFLTAFGTACPQ